MKKNTGEPFEKRVYGWLQTAVSSGTFGLNPNNVRIHRHHPLHSRDRGSDILFDVVLELFRTNAGSPYLTWLWECKDYTHPVPVDDIEEFHAKLEQVARDNGKGTIISTAGFQQSVISLAQSYGIGLMRVVRRTVAATAAMSSPTSTARFADAFDRRNDVYSVMERKSIRLGCDLWEKMLANFLGSLSYQASFEQLFPPAANLPAPTQLLEGAESSEECFVYLTPAGQVYHRETWQQAFAGWRPSDKGTPNQVARCQGAIRDANAGPNGVRLLSTP